MCILNLLENCYDKQTGLSLDLDYVPLKAVRCDYKTCPERQKLIVSVCMFVQKNLMKAIDHDTSLALKEASYPEEASKFSELFRVANQENIEMEDKAQLIGLPSFSRIYCFVADLLKNSKTCTEAIPYQLILLQRLLKNTKWPLRATTWRILLIISLRLTQRVRGPIILPKRFLPPLHPLFSQEELVELEEIFLTLIKRKSKIRYHRYKVELKHYLKENTLT
mmetsp:Transcript_1254/g.1323  ORF Transcript_1254/g.1323 Transcript_1254/m.1323 type:complete len:222 (+) Transcript_1254:79-744(+)